MSDQKDLKDYLAGDVRAFERIVARHEGSLLRFAAFFLDDREAAQDIVQESFLKLIDKARDMAHLKSLSAWLFKVCRNGCIDFIKKEVRMRKTHENAAVLEKRNAPENDAHPIEARESQEVITRALRKLPQNQQEVLILKVQQKKSYKEISRITGLTTGHVGYLVHHGLKNLATRLKAAGAIN